MENKYIYTAADQKKIELLKLKAFAVRFHHLLMRELWFKKSVRVKENQLIAIEYMINNFMHSNDGVVDTFKLFMKTIKDQSSSSPDRYHLNIQYKIGSDFSCYLSSTRYLPYFDVSLFSDQNDSLYDDFSGSNLTGSYIDLYEPNLRLLSAAWTVLSPVYYRTATTYYCNQAVYDVLHRATLGYRQRTVKVGVQNHDFKFGAQSFGIEINSLFHDSEPNNLFTGQFNETISEFMANLDHINDASCIWSNWTPKFYAINSGHVGFIVGKTNEGFKVLQAGYHNGTFPSKSVYSFSNIPFYIMCLMTKKTTDQKDMFELGGSYAK